MVRIVIIDLIFKKEFKNENDNSHSIQSDRNIDILGSLMYLLFSHYIKENISKKNSISKKQKKYLVNKIDFTFNK